MSKLPRISGRKCVKALGKSGFYLKRQEGSHLILRRNEPFTQVVVPDRKVIPHRRALTLRAAKGFYPFGNPDKVTLCQEHREFSH